MLWRLLPRGAGPFFRQFATDRLPCSIAKCSSVAIRTRGHIAIDLLPLVLSPVGRRRFAIFIALIVLAFLAVFFHYSLQHTLRVRGSGQVTPVMQAPMWLAYLAMPAGSVLMMLRSCQVLWRLVDERVDDEKFAMDLQD